MSPTSYQTAPPRDGSKSLADKPDAPQDGEPFGELAASRDVGERVAQVLTLVVVKGRALSSSEDECEGVFTSSRPALDADPNRDDATGVAKQDNLGACGARDDPWSTVKARTDDLGGDGLPGPHRSAHALGQRSRDRHRDGGRQRSGGGVGGVS